MKKEGILALLLALLIMITVVSCGNASESGNVTTPSPVASEGPDNTEAVTEASTVDDKGYRLDDIPADLKLNTEIKMLYWSDVENPEFFVEDTNGEAVNDAIYSRNAKVEERLDITFNYVGKPGNFNNNAAFNREAKTAKNNGDGFDIYAAYSMTTASLANAGLCRDLLKREVIDFEKPWWPDQLISEALIFDKLFFASGDLSTNMLYMMYVSFFNKDFIERYKLENPYELVNKNEWTFDKLFEMSSALDSTGSSGADMVWAFATSNDIHMDPYFFAAGLRVVEKDQDGVPQISEKMSSDRAIAVADAIQQYVARENVTIADKNDEFAKNNALFSVNRARYASKNLANADVSFGIVPVPKYTADQDTFVTILGFPYTLYAIADSSEQPDAASAALECLCSEGYRTITPALFEITMKVRYTTDGLASQMMDKVRENISFDIGRIFTSSLENLPYSIFRGYIKATDGVGYKTTFDSKYSTFSRLLKKLASSFEKIEG